MRAEAPLVAASGVTVTFGSFTALSGIDCRFGGTGVCGLIGVNGAGKTTLIHTLLGLLTPTSGSVYGTGGPETVAYCPDTPSFEPQLTSREVLYQSSRLGRPAADRAGAGDIAACLDRVGLSEAADRRVGGFSRGMRQRLGMAAALVREPSLLILDEPTSALDPVGRDDVLALVAELGRSIRVVFSSHILGDVESVADDLLILHKGRTVYSGAPEGFVDRASADTEVCVSLVGGVDALISRLRDKGVHCRTDESAESTLLVSSRGLPAVLEFVSARPELLRSLTVGGGSTLQRAFLETVAPQEAEEAA